MPAQNTQKNDNIKTLFSTLVFGFSRQQRLAHRVAIEAVAAELGLDKKDVDQLFVDRRGAHWQSYESIESRVPCYEVRYRTAGKVEFLTMNEVAQLVKKTKSYIYTRLSQDGFFTVQHPTDEHELIVVRRVRSGQTQPQAVAHG